MLCHFKEETMKKIVCYAAAMTILASLFAGGQKESTGKANKPVNIMIGYENNPGEPAKFSVSLTYHHWEMINSVDYISPFGNNWRGGADYYGRENRRISNIKSAETPMSKGSLAISVITGYDAEDIPTGNLGGNTP